MQSRGRSLTREAPSAVDQLRHEVTKTTEAAVAEGERDVEAAKSAGAELVDQAKGLVGNAISTGQVNLHILPGWGRCAYFHDSPTCPRLW